MVPQIHYCYAGLITNPKNLYRPIEKAAWWLDDVFKLSRRAFERVCHLPFQSLPAPSLYICMYTARQRLDEMLILIFHVGRRSALSRGPWNLWFPSMGDVVSQYETYATDNADCFLIGLQSQGTSLEMAKALRTAIIEQLRIETTINDLSNINNILESRWHWPTIEARTKELLIELNITNILCTMSLFRQQGLPFDLLPKVAGYFYANDEREELEEIISTVVEQKQHDRQKHLTNASLSSNPNTQFGHHHNQHTSSNQGPASTQNNEKCVIM